MLLQEVCSISITRPPYSPEFRQQIIDLARAGRDPVSLSKEFEPTAETIRKWVAAAGRQEGSREKGDAQAAAGDALTMTERDELARLRRENKQLRVERLDPLCGSSLSRAAAWFARAQAAAQLEGAVPSGSSGS